MCECATTSVAGVGGLRRPEPAASRGGCRLRKRVVPGMRTTIERHDDGTRYSFHVKGRVAEFTGRAVVEQLTTGDAAWALQTGGSYPDNGGRAAGLDDALDSLAVAVEGLCAEAVKWREHAAAHDWSDVLDACRSGVSLEEWLPSHR